MMVQISEYLCCRRLNPFTKNSLTCMSDNRCSEMFTLFISIYLYISGSIQAVSWLLWMAINRGVKPMLIVPLTFLKKLKFLGSFAVHCKSIKNFLVISRKTLIHSMSPRISTYVLTMDFSLPCISHIASFRQNNMIAWKGRPRCLHMKTKRVLNSLLLLLLLLFINNFLDNSV